MALGGGALADEGKDESGKGKQRREEWRQHEGQPSSSYFHQHGYTRIPDGHLPPVTQLRGAKIIPSPQTEISEHEKDDDDGTD